MLNSHSNIVRYFWNETREEEEKKREEEEEHVLFFESFFHVTAFLPYLGRLTRCLRCCFFFISFVVFDSFSSSSFSSSFLLSSITQLKEMPHRIRKIVSKCRRPFIGIQHRRHTLPTTHHCMCFLLSIWFENIILIINRIYHHS
jgi:hypothetical protein